MLRRFCFCRTSVTRTCPKVKRTRHNLVHRLTVIVLTLAYAVDAFALVTVGTCRCRVAGNEHCCCSKPVDPNRKNCRQPKRWLPAERGKQPKTCCGSKRATRRDEDRDRGDSATTNSTCGSKSCGCGRHNQKAPSTAPRSATDTRLRQVVDSLHSTALCGLIGPTVQPSGDRMRLANTGRALQPDILLLSCVSLT